MQLQVIYCRQWHNVPISHYGRHTPQLTYYCPKDVASEHRFSIKKMVKQRLSLLPIRFWQQAVSGNCIRIQPIHLVPEEMVWQWHTASEHVSRIWNMCNFIQPHSIQKLKPNRL